MNLQEFAKLKLGDKIENPSTGSKGEIVEATDSGVRVVWGDPHDRNNHATKFFYSVVGTAWMNWVNA